jgi:hypothetical protein
MHAQGQINFTQLMLCENVSIRIHMMSFDETKPMQKRITQIALLEF